MQRYYDVVLDQFGNPAAGVSVTVYNAGSSTPSSLYLASDNTLTATNPIANPVITDASGVVAFAVASGKYTITYSGSNITPRQITWVTLDDCSSYLTSASAAASYQPLDADLTALAAQTGTGFSVRTGSGTWDVRTLQGTTNQVTVTNGDGVSGNPTFSLPQNIHTAATPSFAGLTVNGSLSATTGTFSSLTSGRIPYATTGGALVDSAGLTYNGTVIISTTLSAGGAGLIRATPVTVATTNIGLTNTGGSIYFGLDSSTGGNFGAGNYGGLIYNGANSGLTIFTNATNRGGWAATGEFSVTASTASTSTTTGALVVTGGVGIGGALNVGGTVTISGNNNLTLPKTSGYGIKVDSASPTFGWHDLLGEITVRGTGAADPTWATYVNGIRQYQFTVNDEVWTAFHIPHDYVPSSDLYLHAHWSHTSTTVASGTVSWAFEITSAKGHNQAAFGTTVTATATQTASTTQRQHMIAEVQISSATPTANQINNSTIEVDSLLLVRCYLSANSMTGTVEPFLHCMDIHYQSTGIPTKAKAPNFYT